MQFLSHDAVVTSFTHSPLGHGCLHIFHLPSEHWCLHTFHLPSGEVKLHAIVMCRHQCPEGESDVSTAGKGKGYAQSPSTAVETSDPSAAEVEQGKPSLRKESEAKPFDYAILTDAGLKRTSFLPKARQYLAIGLKLFV